MAGRVAVLAFAYFTLSLAGGLYWTSATMFCVDSGLGYAGVALVTTAPLVLSLLSRMFGALADAYGHHRELALVGTLGVAVSMGLAYSVKKAPLLVVPSALLSLSWSLVGPLLWLEAMRGLGPGKGAGVIEGAGTAGWTLSVIIAGPLYDTAGLPGTSLAALALSLLTAPLIAALPSPRGRTNLAGAVKLAFKRAIAVSGAEAERSLLVLVFLSAYYGSGSVWSAKLYGALGQDPRRYTAVLFAAGLVSVVASPAVGVLVDRVGVKVALAVAAAAYTATNLSFALTDEPLALSLACLVPVYPASVVTVYALVGGRRASAKATGTVDALSSAASLLAPLVGIAADSIGVLPALAASNAVLVATVACLVRLLGAASTLDHPTSPARLV